MKKTEKIKYLVFVLLIVMFSFVLPLLWKIITDDTVSYPFTYYSSVNKSFCYIDYSDKEIKRKDNLGNTYTDKQFDSILPMFYYRQLAIDGNLPDSLNGLDLSVKKIRMNNFFFRYRPANISRPGIKLYRLFESKSGKVDLEMPGDVFRMTIEGVEFINPENNEVIAGKSKQYSKILMKLGYEGPPKVVGCNPSARKAYEEGCFIVDQKNQFFHMKMVNGKPFVKKKKLSEDFEPVHIANTEYPDKRFYGFVFDERNNIYYISTDNYKLVKIPLPEFSYLNYNLLIMANMFYWNVASTTQKGKTIYAVDAKHLNVVDSIHYLPEKNQLKAFSKYIFPGALSFNSHKSKYLESKLRFEGFHFIWLNIFLLVLYNILLKWRKQAFKLPVLIGIFLTGIYGFLSALLINFEK